MGQNQKKDTSQKTLEWYNDIFADIVNVIIFNGKPMLHMEELIDALDAFTGDNRSETAYNVNNLKEYKL